MIKFETDTPVQGEYREAALSALEKFRKKYEEEFAKLDDKEQYVESKMFEFYLPVGTTVIFDSIVMDNPTWELSRYKYSKYLNVIGTVKEVYSDLHAFGRGSSYSAKVEFGEDILDIPFLFITEYTN
jgi:hypothetical protein